MPPASIWTIRKLPKTGLHGRSIRDLINGVGLVDAQIRRIRAILTRSSPPPRQSVAESSICVFYSNPYRRPYPHEAEERFGARMRKLRERICIATEQTL